MRSASAIAAKAFQDAFRVVLLAVACAVAACGAVTPASGPPTYGDGRGNSSN